MAEETVTVNDSLSLQISDQKDVINLGNDRTKINVDSKEPEIFVNEKYEILPSYAYTSVDFTIPQSVIDGLLINIDDLRKAFTDQLAGNKVAILDELEYHLTHENGAIRQQLIDLDTKYVSTGVIDEYARISELTNQVIAKEYLIDRWTQGYIQDRSDWDVDFLHTDGQTYNNNSYLQARWAQPDITSANTNYPLTGLGGTPIFDGGGGIVYRYTTDITSQDIYDKSVRVENSMASYLHEIEVFANNQSAYASELSTLNTYAGEFGVRLDTLDGVTAGMFHVWDGVEPVKIGMIKFVGDKQYQYLGSGLGDLGDGWVRTDKSAQDSVTALNNEILNVLIPDLQSQIDGAISTWFFDGSPEYSADDTTTALQSTSIDTGSELITGAFVFDIQYKQMLKFLGANELNTNLTLEDFTDTLRWEPIYKMVKPEAFWMAEDAGTTAVLSSISTDSELELVTNALVYHVAEDQMYQFLGLNEANVNLTLEDYTDTLRWTPVAHTKVTTSRDNHLGDIYYDNATGFGYRFSKLDIEDRPDQGEIYSWISITDGAALEALEAASLAQETADGKATVYYLAEAPTLATHPNLSVGDVYVNDTTKIARTWDGTQWVDNTTVSAETAKGWAGGAAKFVGPTDVNGLPTGPITGWTFGSSLTGAQYTSEFAIHADHFYLNSSSDPKYRPFEVDAVTGEIIFRGKVTFQSIQNAPTHTSGAGDPTGVAPIGSTYNKTDAPTSTWLYTSSGWVINGQMGAITQNTLNTALAHETTTIDGSRIRSGSIVLEGLGNYIIPAGYSGTIIDKKGVRVYNNGICRVKLGDLA